MSDPDRQYRDLADLNPDAFIIQVEGKVVYCNQSARRMFNDGESVRLIGIDAIQLVDPEFRDFILKRRNSVLSTGEPAPYAETRHLRLDGASFPSEMVVGQVTWGGRAGTMNIIHDITKRKQAHEALRESEVRLSNAAEMAKIGHWVWDKIEDKAIYCSEALAKMYGVESGVELAAVCTSHVADLTWVHPDDRERFDEAVRAANESKRGFDMEYRIINAAGEVRHLHNIEEPVLNEHGEIIRSNGITQDITERKRAEETLRESEALFRALVDNLPVEIVMRDTKGRYLLVNPAWEKTTGRRHEDVIGATVHDVFAKEEADLYMAQDRAMLAAGRVLDQEVEITREGGAQILHMIKFPIPDALGIIAGIGGITTDITERKRVEQSLRESRDQMRLITDNLPFAISYLDNKGRYRFVNRTVETWFGRPADEIFGHTIGDVLGQEAHYAVAPQVAAALKGTEQHDERVIGFPDGKTRTVEITYVPDIDESETVRGCFALGQDVTERKRTEEELRESEARYRAIVEDQTELICRYLPDQTFTFVNDSYCRYFDQAREDLIGRKFAPLIPDEDLEIIMRRLAALNPEGPLITHEHRVVAPGGEIRWHLWTDRAIFDTEGRVIEYQSVGRDITDQKSVDAQLRQAQKMEALGQLASGTAHEINNLLQPIISFASLTRDEIEDSEHRHNLDRVLECGRRAMEIVADILTFARRAPGKPEAIEVRELLMTTVRFVRDLIPSTIELRSEISTDTGQALINRTEFTQVIINLAQNAADAIDRAGTISIATKIVHLAGHRAIQRHLSDGRYCRVSVKDTGSGMAAETLKRIFEPFFTTKPAGKGTGLGLSVVYGIVTGWGGSVSADSVVGEGSVFDVYIPLM